MSGWGAYAELQGTWAITGVALGKEQKLEDTIEDKDVCLVCTCAILSVILNEHVPAQIGLIYCHQWPQESLKAPCPHSNWNFGLYHIMFYHMIYNISYNISTCHMICRAFMYEAFCICTGPQVTCVRACVRFEKNKISTENVQNALEVHSI